MDRIKRNRRRIEKSHTDRRNKVQDENGKIIKTMNYAKVIDARILNKACEMLKTDSSMDWTENTVRRAVQLAMELDNYSSYTEAGKLMTNELVDFLMNK